VDTEISAIQEWTKNNKPEDISIQNRQLQI
jgi:hypothetical protein